MVLKRAKPCTSRRFVPLPLPLPLPLSLPL